jgi:1-acyl-sn-glycerol-3-phosphate acyltransferase
MSKPLWPDRLSIHIQSLVAWLAYPFISLAVHLWLLFYLKVRVPKLKQYRKEFKKIQAEHPHNPFIICANHLTLIDSIILSWILTGFWRGLLHPKSVVWHVPERKNFSGFPKGPICYLAKSLFIERMGLKSRNQTILKQMQWLTSNKSIVVIFPEGGRSRTGRVDVENYQYGVGDIIKGVPNCRVLCAYLRANHQVSYSDLPAKNQRFRLLLEMIHPQTDLKGLRASRDLATQIISKLSCLEKSYFKSQSG